MADTYKFYCERADAAAVAAAEAKLDNVRQRELRAEKTWRGLAEKAQAAAKQREKDALEKAGRLTDRISVGNEVLDADVRSGS